MLRKKWLLIILVLAIGSSSCRNRSTVSSGETGPVLIRLGPMVGSGSATVESHIRIDAQNFGPYQGEGWSVANGVIMATESPAIYLIPDPRRIQEWKLRFRGRSSSSRTMRILAQGKEIASLTLNSQWQDYQIAVVPKDFEKPKVKQLQFAFPGEPAGSNPFAEFQYFEIPAYSWGRVKLGNQERAALTLRAKSRMLFDVNLSGGHPRLFFGIGLPSREQGPVPTTFRIASGSKTIYERKLRAERWVDENVDLTPYAGKSMKLEFSSTPESDGTDQVIAWSSPEIYNISAKRDHPNIILLSVDTLRADRVSYYGSSVTTTPNLDSLARKSIVYKNAFCTFPGTLPSHTSVMTGLYVSQHQVGRSSEKIDRLRRISLDLTTIAEVGQQGDYFTAGITDGGFVSGFYGFDQGFQQYTENEHIENRNEIATITNATKWLRSNFERPFFLFLHTYTVHEPFNPPREMFRKLFPDYPLKEGENPSVSMDWLLKVNSGKIVPTEQEKDFVRRCYEAEIYYFDQTFGSLLGELRKLGLDKNTVILVFGDHGEMFFDRYNLFGHGKTLWREEIRVPLILYVPGSPHQERNDLVSLIDVYPTFCELMGIKPAHPVSGISLLQPPDSKLRTNRCIYYEVNYGKEAQWGVQSREFKLILDRATGHEYFYDLRKDPEEGKDVSSSASRSMALMRQMLNNYIQQSITPVAHAKGIPEKEESRELKEQLKALGYLN